MTEAQKKNPKGRLIRFTGWAAAILVALFLSLYGALQTPWAKNLLADAAEAALSKDGERTLTIGRVSGAGLAFIVAEDVKLSDASGVWLELGEAKIDWHPLSLILGTLSVDLLEAQGLHILRPPQSESSEPFELPSAPSVPLNIVVDRLVLHRTVLEAAIAGERRELHGEGHFFFRERSGFDVAFEATTSPGSEPLVNIEGRYDRRVGTLAIDIAFLEAPGGYVGRLLNLPEESPFSLTAAGDGPIENWRGRLDLTSGALELAALDLLIEETGGGRLSIVGDLSPIFPWPDQLETVLTGPYEVALKASISDGQVIELFDSSFENEFVLVALQGDVDLARQELDASAKLTMEDAATIAALLPSVSAQRFSVEAEVEGKVAQPLVRVTAKLNSFAAGSIASPQMTANATLDATQGLDRPLSISLDGLLETLSLSPGDDDPVSFDNVTWGVEATYDNASREIIVTDGMLSNPYVSAKLEGRADVTNAGSPEMAFLVSGAIIDVPIDNEALEAWFTEPATFAAGISRNPAWAEEWKFDNLELAHPDLLVRSNLSFGGDAGRLSGRYDVTLRNIEQAAAIFGVNAQGDTLQLGGQISQTADEIAGETEASLASLSIEGTELRDVKAKFALAGNGDPLKGTLTGTFDGPLGPTTLSAELTRDASSGDLGITNAKLKAGSNRINGNMHLSGDGGPIDGALEGELTSLRELSGIFGQRLAGNISFSSSLSGSDADLQFVLQADGTRLSGDIPGFGVVNSRSLSVTAESVPSGGETRVRFAIKGEDVDKDRVQFDALEISGTTTGDNTQFSINGAGFFEGELNLQAGGSVDRGADTLVIAVNNLAARLQNDDWSLNQDVRIERRASGTSITPFVFSSGQRRISFDSSTTNQVVNAKVQVNDVPLQLVALLSPRYALGGSVSGDAELSAQVGASNGSLRFDIQDLRPRGIVGNADTLSGPITGSWNGTELSLQGRLSGAQQGAIDLSVAVPFLYDDAGFRAPDDQPLSGQFKWQADIAPLWQIAQPDLHSLSGDVNADVVLAGTLAQPQLTGSLVLRGGTYRHLEFGTVLSNLGVDVALQNEALTIRRGSGTTSNGGTVALEGDIQVDPERQFPARLAFNFDKAELVRRDDVTGSASGSFVYARDESGASFSGKIESETIEAKLVGGLPANVVDLDVIEVGGARLPDQANDEDLASTEFAKTKLEVNVTVPGQAFVRGRGLDSEWAGNLRIKGTLATPIITGQLRVVRGRFDFASRAFDLDGGTLTFEGTEKIDPRLNLQATYEDDDFTAATRISGPSSKPSVSLSSSPSLPDDEILARILFGNSVSELSPLEALQLAEAARSLSSGGSGGVGGFIGATRDTLGLDTLRIGAAGEEAIQPSITGGKYLTKDIYLELETDPSGASDRVTLEVDVTNNIAVESELTSETGSNIGVKWQWDY